MVRVLGANKKRHGFPPLYITAAVTGGVKRSVLRFLNKTITVTQQTAGWLQAVPGDGYASAFPTSCQSGVATGIAIYLAAIGTGSASSDIDIDPVLGEVSYTGSIAASNGINVINNLFGNRKDAGGFTNSGSGSCALQGGGSGTWTYEEELTFDYDGVDIIGAYYYYRQEVLDGLGAQFGILETEWQITLGSGHTDAVLEAAADDLLQNYDTGTANGINGLADNTIGYIHWNESDVNSALGSASSGAFGITATTLDAFTALDAPAIQFTAYSASSFYDGVGRWWQHSGGGYSNGETYPGDPAYSFFDCTFSDDDSMAYFGAATDASYSYILKHHFRFNVADPVCGEFDNVDNASTTGTDCRASTGGGGRRLVIQPNPVTVSNSNVRRFSSGLRFTAPGYLTGGVCPCSSAP